MKIELLWFEDCPNHHAARELLESVVTQIGVSDPIVSIEVPDVETGERTRFPGSPTIRIDGADIDPTYKDQGDYAPRCRVYMTEAGFSGVPQRDWIENALRQAVSRT